MTTRLYLSLNAALLVAGLGAAVSPLACGPRPARAAGASDDFPELADPVTLRQRQALGILDQVLPANPTPTPFSPGFVLEVTIAGNVALPGEPYMLIVAGKCPIELVPPRCRDDFKRLPRGASLVCMRNDEIRQRLVPPDTAAPL